MGISTIQSYLGAQIFEAVGLSQKIIDRYFTSTPSPLGGMGLEEIAREAVLRHEKAFARVPDEELDSGGRMQYRADGERHLFNPKTIHKLQQACRSGSYAQFKEYSEMITSTEQQQCTLRGLLKFKEGLAPVPLDEVESVESICRRFKTGAMSYGSISREAHEALAIAMNRIGGKSNTGEGGEDPARFIPDENGDSPLQRHQAGGFRPLRRYRRVLSQCQGDSNQNGAGRQARRRRSASGAQGLSLGSQGPLLHAWRRPDFSPAAP